MEFKFPSIAGFGAKASVFSEFYVTDLAGVAHFYNLVRVVAGAIFYLCLIKRLAVSSR